MKSGRLMTAFAIATSLAFTMRAATNATGIVYSTIPAAEGHPAVELKLDLSVPQSNGPVPCFIYVHGGSWKAGSRKNCPYVAPLGKLGWAVASIDYRLTDKGRNPFPAQIIDTKEAIRFLRANASQFGLDPELFCIAGSSAGGHLASLAGVTSGYDAVCREKPVKDPACAVAAVVDMFGPTDLRVMAAPMIAFVRQNPGTLPQGAEDGIALLGTNDIDEAVKLLDEASPAAFLEGRLPTATMPRFLILHSKGDSLVPVAQAELFHAALEKAGVKSELHLYDAKGHYLPPQSMADLTAFLSSLRATRN